MERRLDSSNSRTPKARLRLHPRTGAESGNESNIRWNKHTYVFEVVESDTPVLALNLENQAQRKRRNPPAGDTRALACVAG